MVIASLGPRPVDAQIDHRAVVDRFLLQACLVGERNVEGRWRVLGRDAVPALVRALGEGPGAAEVERVRAHAERLVRRIGSVRERGATGLRGAELEVARRLDFDGLIRQAVDDFRFSYRSEAVRALGVLGGAEAIGVLERVADDPTSPLRSTARLALGRWR